MNKILYSLLNGLTISAMLIMPINSMAAPLNLSDAPLFLGDAAPSLSMIVMGRDHKLYYEAYNDASDLDGDGKTDIGYKPSIGGYFGYFESYMCYSYDGATETFIPFAKTPDRKCVVDTDGNSIDGWSGDFLNYITTSRIDALRKVLYGGSRSIDTPERTVLKRSFIPQDAHSWGKEYNASIDGDSEEYEITEYTPLAEPNSGTRHVFANVSLSEDGQPLMRIMKNTTFRVWQWLSIERPVAGDDCFDNDNIRVDCIPADNTRVNVPSSNLRNLTRSFYDLSGVVGDHPNNHNQYDRWVEDYAVPGRLDGTDSPSTVQGSDNPFDSASDDDDFLTVISGEIVIPSDGSYTFYVDGDDAVEFILNPNSPNERLVGYYGGHGFCNCDDHELTVTLTSGTHPFEFRHEERGQGQGYVLQWSGSTASGASLVDYAVNVEVCSAGFVEAFDEGTPEDTSVSPPIAAIPPKNTSNCKAYADGNYKPSGVLIDKAEEGDNMYGLITGSFENNLQGGVLRKPISPLTDELDLNTGVFSSVNGVISSIDKLKIWGFNYGPGQFIHNRPARDNGTGACSFLQDPLENGQCVMWGNPIGEMLYESLRYFAGAGTPTEEFIYNELNASGNPSQSIDAELELPLADWNNPYDLSENGFRYCAKPLQVIISDVNPSFDSDMVPGSAFNASFAPTEANNLLNDLNVAAEAQKITDGEGDIKDSLRYIGQVSSGFSATDTTPTAKPIQSLGEIRGLAPEEPSKEGGFNTAALAYYGYTRDLNAAGGKTDNFIFPKSGRDRDTTIQNPSTVAVALASPLTDIVIPIGDTGRTVTIIPFARTPIVPSLPEFPIGRLDPDNFQATNQIVDFYIESLADDGTEGSFLVNFEDIEAGGDHDMDAIVRYTYKFIPPDQVQVDLDSIFAGGGADQHMGYIISGVGDDDGIYLEVHDRNGRRPLYYLDTPPGAKPYDGSAPRGTTRLGLQASRTFTVDTTGAAAATLLRDPLWYAAKWGGFDDLDGDGTPQNNDATTDIDIEWDADKDGNPDNYFLVTNPLNLRQQLTEAFTPDVVEGSSASVAVNSGSISSDSLLFQATFDSDDWSGNVTARGITATRGVGGAADTITIGDPPVWQAREEINAQFSGVSNEYASRNVFTYRQDLNKGINFAWPADPANPSDTELEVAQSTALASGVLAGQEESLVSYLLGDTSNEGENGNQYRERTYILGDVIHSSPLFVSNPSEFYPDTWPSIDGGPAPENGATQKYSDFRVQFFDREPVIYFGANDGMYHGINANETGGDEILAYVPSPVLNNLSELTDPNYVHRSFVDGPSVNSDVFFDSLNRWHSVVVGSLRSGGQGLFALDVTNPHGLAGAGAYASFGSNEPEDIVLWEFTDEDDLYTDTNTGISYSDLGFTYGEPSIIRLANGQWAAAFGNGYNNTVADNLPSQTGNAVIYIVDIEDGSIIKKFDTGVGANEDPLGQARPNGIGSVSPIDRNGDNIADTIYAGDLFGNVWKFDISSNDTSLWDSAFPELSGPPEPLYIARDSLGNPQPITTGLQVTTHPEFRSGENFMVYFGTGQYIEVTDNEPLGQNTQSFYGIWDNDSPVPQFTTDRSIDLLQQSIEAQSGGFRFTSVQEIDWTGADPDRGWFIDLIFGTDNLGERQVTDASFRNDLIIFSTLIPSTDPCQPGGTGFLMQLDAESGSAAGESTVDTNNDGVIDSRDAPSGELSEVGILSESIILANPFGGDDIILTSGSEGAIDVSFTPPDPTAIKRQSWREVVR